MSLPISLMPILCEPAGMGNVPSEQVREAESVSDGDGIDEETTHDPILSQYIYPRQSRSALNAQL